MYRLRDISQFIKRTYRGLALLGLRVRVNSVLALWAVPDLVRRTVVYFRREVPKRQLVPAAIVAMVMVTTLTLYLDERGSHNNLKSAYRQMNSAAAAEEASLRHTLTGLVDEHAVLRQALLEAGFPVAHDGQLSLQVVATGYSSSVIETDSTPWITASNTKPRRGVVALSRDLLKRYTPDAPFQFGDVVHITGFGNFVVEDSMHWRWGKRLDIWFPTREDAFAFGKRNVVIRSPLATQRGEAETTLDFQIPVNIVSGSASATGSAPK